jgi:two-component system, OmpR family, sensor histidine kinase MprB
VSLRTRLVLSFVALTTLATIAVGAWSYVATVDRLFAEIDRSLDDIAAIAIDRGTGDQPGDAGIGGETGGPPPSGTFTTQVIDGAGAVVRSEPGVAIPVAAVDTSIAGGTDRAARTYRDVTLDGGRYRLLTAALTASPGAVQVVRSLAEIDRLSASLRTGIVVAVLVIAALAAAAGWLVARQLTRRLDHLVRATEEVATTGNLDIDLSVGGRDEIGALAASFATMLESLRRSRDAQRRLVQDAGHELRTPLTSLRTNIGVLRRHPDLAVDDRSRLVDDLDLEARELSTLADELIELAAERRDDEPIEAVALGALAERAAERTRRRTGREVLVEADDSVVLGRPTALDRAVSNLLDNASKFDDTGGPISVEVRAGTIAVLDRGPGIPADDLDHVFDRFFRSAGARSRPGSGLGLAIVREIAESHGGTVFAADRDEGGARVGFSIPLAPVGAA